MLCAWKTKINFLTWSPQNIIATFVVPVLFLKDWKTFFSIWWETDQNETFCNSSYLKIQYYATKQITIATDVLGRDMALKAKLVSNEFTRVFRWESVRGWCRDSIKINLIIQLMISFYLVFEMLNKGTAGLDILRGIF